MTQNMPWVLWEHFFTFSHIAFPISTRSWKFVEHALLIIRSAQKTAAKIGRKIGQLASKTGIIHKNDNTPPVYIDFISKGCVLSKQTIPAC